MRRAVASVSSSASRLSASLARFCSIQSSEYQVSARVCELNLEVVDHTA